MQNCNHVIDSLCEPILAHQCLLMHCSRIIKHKFKISIFDQNDLFIQQSIHHPIIQFFVNKYDWNDDQNSLKSLECENEACSYNRWLHLFLISQEQIENELKKEPWIKPTDWKSRTLFTLACTYKNHEAIIRYYDYFNEVFEEMPIFSLIYCMQVCKFDNRAKEQLKQLCKGSMFNISLILVLTLAIEEYSEIGSRLFQFVLRLLEPDLTSNEIKQFVLPLAKGLTQYNAADVYQNKRISELEQRILQIEELLMIPGGKINQANKRKFGLE